MNIQDISKLLPGLYTARKTNVNTSAAEDISAAQDSPQVDRYEASPPIESELPDPDGPASSATPEVLRRFVTEALLKQYSQGNAYYRMLYDTDAIEEIALSSSPISDLRASDTSGIATDMARAERMQTDVEYERAVSLVGEDGQLSPRSVAADIAAAVQLMLNLNPIQYTGFQLSLRMAFSDFGKMFGGQLPPITQQTLMTFYRDYDPFRTEVHVTEADEPVLETSPARPMEERAEERL